MLAAERTNDGDKQVERSLPAAEELDGSPNTSGERVMEPLGSGCQESWKSPPGPRQISGEGSSVAADGRRIDGASSRLRSWEAEWRRARVGSESASIG